MPNNFNVPATEMLEDARTKRLLFIGDKAAFVAIDPDFADPFEADWLAAIVQGEGVETAENRMDRQMDETQYVQEAMAEATRVYITAKYYIEKAYAGRPSFQNNFGLNDFSTSGNTQNGMAVFLTNLFQKCNSAEYKPDLLAAGMTQDQIDSIDAAYNLFVNDNSDQNLFIETNAQASKERSDIYNDCYAYMQRVNRASKVVFYGNPVKLNQYELPHGSEGVNYAIEGDVLDGSNNNKPLKGVTVEIVQNGAGAVTNARGKFGFVGITPGNYTLQLSLPGYTTLTAPVQLSANSRATVNLVMQLAP